MLCFRKIPVAKKFMDKRRLEYHVFLSKIFFSQCRKNQQGNPSVLCFGKLLVAKTFMDKKGEYQEFPLKCFCLTVPITFVGKPFSVSLVSGIESFYASEGCITIFRRELFVSQYRNISQGNPSVLCFRKLPAAKKFMDKRGWEYQGFLSNFFCLTVPNNLLWETFYAVFQKISGGEKAQR